MNSAKGANGAPGETLAVAPITGLWV